MSLTPVGCIYSWLLQQPQDGLQRIFVVGIEPQLLLQLLNALAKHLSKLAPSRCNSCCCCCQTRSGAGAAAAEAAAAAADEGAFCCRIAYRVSLTAGFLSFLASLQGTARGARLLLQKELQQVSYSFGEALAALHAPIGGTQQPGGPPAAAPDAASRPVCCCKSGKTNTPPPPPPPPPPAAAAEGCCHTKRATQELLRVLGAPDAGKEDGVPAAQL